MERFAMAASYALGPDDPIGLSAREKRILAVIEDQLWSSDPEFGLRMAAGPGAGRGGSWTADRYGAAVAAVLLLVVVAAVLAPSWRGVLGLVLALGVLLLPWLLLRAIERNTAG
jgi:hypothetical protein